MINKRNDSRQKKIDAGLVSEHFPGVSSIVVNMMYNQKGIAKPIRRVVNFSADSYAYFRIECLTKNCVDGGFDLTRGIKSMIKNRKKKFKGTLSCKGDGVASGHSDIDYEVNIKYS
jgi:hypothetical protein